MGKSEIVPIPIERQGSSFYAVCKEIYKMNEDGGEDGNNGGGDSDHSNGIPKNMEVFVHQVAGHSNDGKSIGLIKCAGTILKPLTNEKCGEREINFYEELKKFNTTITTNQDLIDLKEFIPQYYGTITIPIKERNINCLILEDLTMNFKEPCIMDVKIGRRTWDPEATYDKIVKEQNKYHDCKRDLAFCIPGFQVYDLTTKQLQRYDKDYGKKLDKNTIKQTLKLFLNGNRVICRNLIVQFLANLWKIQLWARHQHYYHLYSSSLLFVYDARRLRELINNNNNNGNNNDNIIDKTEFQPKLKLQRSTSLYRPLSLAVLNNNEKISTGFSGQLTIDGPILKTTTTRKLKGFDLINNTTNNYYNQKRGLNNNGNNCNVWQKSIRMLKRTHSFQNDYDKEMQNKKQNYTNLLDELCMEQQKSELWAFVKMIDFAHAYHTEHYYEIDKNYLEGIDNLVKLFEEFLVESEEF